MTIPNFDTLYTDATAERREQLRTFRQSHPASVITVNGHSWEVIDYGQGQPILWLVGGLRVADAAFRSIPMLDESFRIIAPSYPALPTMAEMVEGLAAILDACDVTQTAILANSFGGMIAQCFVRAYPRRVSALLLSSTTSPSGIDVAKYQQELALVDPLPEEIIREGAKQRFYDIVQPPEEEGDFWRAFFNELFSYRLDKDNILSTYRAIIDFGQHYQFSSTDLDEWDGRILILDADDDATFDADARAKLRALYPHAQTHTFIGGGHAPTNTFREQYFQLARDFFAA